MLEALQCYSIVATAIYAGYFRLVADLLWRAWSESRGIAARAVHVGKVQVRSLTATADRLSPSGTAAAAAVCGAQDEWARRLARLESYVAAMA